MSLSCSLYAGVNVGGNAWEHMRLLFPGPPFLHSGDPRPQRALSFVGTHIPRLER